MNNSRQPPVYAGPRGGNEVNSTTNHRPSVSPNEAALTGAAKAFINGLPKEELVRLVNRRSPQPLPVKTTEQYSHSTASSINLVQSDQQQQQKREEARSRQSSSGGQHHLPIPAANNGARSNQSSLAAALAAVRSSPGRNPASWSDGRRRDATSPTPSVRARGGSASTTASNRLDETPIPATTSLVKMFEERKQAPAGEIRGMPVGNRRDVSVESIKEAPVEEAQEEVPLRKVKEVVPLERVKTPPVIASKPPTLQSPTPQRRSYILTTSSPTLFPPSSHQPLHDQTAAKELLKETGLNLATDLDDNESLDSYASAKEALSPIKSDKPSLPLPRIRTRPPANLTTEITPPAHSGPSTARSTPMPIARPPSTSNHSAHSHTSRSQPSIAAAYHQMHPRRMTPLTTGDALASANSLANAIVASSLASSRAPSPHKAPPVPAPRHKPGSISHSLFSRTPSPPKKGMRQTMRSWSSASSDDEDVPFAKHKKKKRFIRKHPNKHHEGDRKRWRDAVTERERKRYEGVWAANKGLHMFHTPEEQRILSDTTQPSKYIDDLREVVADQVVDIVVRDIWSRSRLHDDILEQVWDLVDTQKNGRLTKEEFVVGLWLIDQCLKGRKLPVKVSDSVWSSVKFIQGIKVRTK